jgi:hypothetical protein
LKCSEEDCIADFVIRRETDGVYRPMSFGEWIKSSVIPKEIKSLVENNRKLNYLRNLV